ncbi:stage II sporulation protein M [Methanogenium cariaci]|jgi:stage II sporulation protein M
MFDGSYRTAAIVTVGILLLTGIIGAFAVHADPSVGESLVAMMNEEVFNNIESENPAIVAFNIFANNTQTSLILFIGGASFGLLTALILSFNGFIIGIVVEFVRQEQGLYVILAGILPHGIFEIPALVLAGMFGILLGEELWKELHGNGDAISAAHRMGKQFLVYVLPLLGIAAIIEGFITPEIIQLFI